MLLNARGEHAPLAVGDHAPDRRLAGVHAPLGGGERLAHQRRHAVEREAQRARRGDPQRVVERAAERGDVCPDPPRSGTDQRALLEAEPRREHAERHDAGALGGQRVVGRVADHRALGGRDAEPLHGRDDGIGKRLGVLDVALPDDDVHHVAQIVAGTREGGVEMLVSGRRRERRADAATSQLLEQRACAGEDREAPLARELQVDALGRLAERLAVLRVRLTPQDVGHEVVAALADLGPDAVGMHAIAVLCERAHPGLDVGGVGVDEGAVEVEQESGEHGAVKT